MKTPPKRKNKPGAGRPKGTTKAPTERLHVRLPLGTVAFLEARAGGMGMSVAAMLANGACPECMERANSLDENPAGDTMPPTK